MSMLSFSWLLIFYSSYYCNLLHKTSVQANKFNINEFKSPFLSACLVLLLAVVDKRYWKAPDAGKLLHLQFDMRSVLFSTVLLSINRAICLLVLFHLQIALNSFIVPKDVIWGMIHLMRQAHRWAVFRDRRLLTVALWIEFQSEVKEKKIPWRKKVEFDPEAQGPTHFSTEGVSFFELRILFMT